MWCTCHCKLATASKSIQGTSKHEKTYFVHFCTFLYILYMYIWQKSGGHVQKWSWTPPLNMCLRISPWLGTSPHSCLTTLLSCSLLIKISLSRYKRNKGTSKFWKKFNDLCKMALQRQELKVSCMTAARLCCLFTCKAKTGYIISYYICCTFIASLTFAH